MTIPLTHSPSLLHCLLLLLPYTTTPTASLRNNEINKHCTCIYSPSRPHDRRLYNSRLSCPLLAQKRMDSRTNTSHPAFSRPLSQPALRDPRHAPIPPPPYTLQAPVRTAHHLNHDPFLQRRNDYEDSWQEQSKPTSQAAFSLGTYVGSAPRDALGTATENRERVQENSGNWRFADGRIDRYRSQSGDGKQIMRGYICHFLLCISGALFFYAPLHYLLTVLVVHPLLASPLPNATESHILGLWQLLELSNPWLVAIVQRH